MASAHPWAAWLRQAVGGQDKAAVRHCTDGLPPGPGRLFVVRVPAETSGAEQPLSAMVAATPDDVFALAVLGAHEVHAAWEIRDGAGGLGRRTDPRATPVTP